MEHTDPSFSVQKRKLAHLTWKGSWAGLVTLHQNLSLMACHCYWVLRYPAATRLHLSQCPLCPGGIAAATEKVHGPG